MRFRRIYWVTEQLDGDKSEVTGVFTSIHDLIEDGLPMHDGEFRVGLFELDSTRRCLLSFVSSSSVSVAEELKPFVASGELTYDEVGRLAVALKKQ